MKRWTEVDPRARLLIDSIGRSDGTCAACGGAERVGYACRCSVPSRAHAPDRGVAYALMTEPGSDRVASSPLVKCYPIPVATIQPRNEIPTWARRFFRALERRLEVPDGLRGVPVIVAWGVATFAVAAALFVRWAWNGPGPSIVADEPKQLTGGPRP